MKSFKQMIQAGEVKRADAMKVQPCDLHEEPGFNLRQEGEELEASIEALKLYILDGGVYPPLEVRPREEGGVWIVDGHRRSRAIKRAIESGAAIEWVNVIAFTGNDADRTLRVITSAEGRGLSPLETAMGYKKLAAFGWEPDQIAGKVGKTRQHVDQLLILANAPTKVHQLVAAGKVSAAVAVDAVRKHGDEAGNVLDGELGKAKAAGKGKVTAGTIKGKALPAKVTQALVDGMDAFTDALEPEAHELMAGVRNGTEPEDVVVEVKASTLAALLACHQDVMDARAEQKRRAKEKAAKAAQAELA
ncbi:Chromosome-partitioning protein Spo0J [compost metagenome]